MTKKLSLLWACIVCLLSLSGTVQAQGNFRSAPDQLEAVTQEVISSRESWMQLFPASEISEFGFRSVKELELAEAGKPIEVYLMYRNAKGAEEVKASGEYLVPLQLDGNARAFLTVAFFEGRYQVVSAGEMHLAQDAAAYISHAVSARGTRLVWLRNLNHSADFIANAASAIDLQRIVFRPLFTAHRAGLAEPMPFAELLKRFEAMPVHLD